MDAVARRYGLAGERLVARGEAILLDRAYGTVSPTGGRVHRPAARRRLAYIAKQVTATLPMRDPGATLLTFQPRTPSDRRWPAGMAMACAGEVCVSGFVAGMPEPRYELASFGAAGRLMGTARAVFDFDRQLMTGKLLSPGALAELSRPADGRSYQALVQWVLPGQLGGRASPKRIVQRDGEIGGVQTRNFILPDDGLVVIVFTSRGSDDVPIGEIRHGKGFAYELPSAAACA